MLQNYIPEFEQQTGMKVDLQLSAFPVYNQQANLELASGGSAFDFVNVTFILVARRVAAGLLSNLDEFISDPNLTPAEWQPKDFVDGAQVPYRDVAPGIAATAILCFLYAWNDFFFALILTRTNARTAPVAVVNFMNYEGWEWGKIAAGGSLVMAPVLIFSLAVRRYLVSGLTAGAVKG